jgi:uncharacterized FlaG/YvyC family protein
MMTETRYTKHTFTDAELLGISRKMANAHNIISEKEDVLKSFASTIKADIAQQEAVIHQCSEWIRSGYEMKQRECSLRYEVENYMVKYLDKDTGEIVDERPMTNDEQLKMSDKPKTEDETVEEKDGEPD